MRTIVLLFAMLGAPAAFAENVLICHAQTVPAELAGSLKSPLSSSLIEGVFDWCFDRGDIAYDTALSEADAATAVGLRSLSSQYGADETVYVGVVWKMGPQGAAALDRVDYRMVNSSGGVLREGSLTADLASPSKDEDAQVASVTSRVLAALR